jgi:hypothetical protein
MELFHPNFLMINLCLIYNVVTALETHFEVSEKSGDS